MSADGPVERRTVRARAQVEDALIDRLIGDGVLAESEGAAWLHRARAGNEILEWVLRGWHGLLEEDLLRLLSEITGFAYLEANELVVEPEAVPLVPARLVLNHQVMPVKLVSDGQTVVLATDRVPTLHDEDELRLLIGRSVRWVLCGSEHIARAVKAHYGVGVRAFVRDESAGAQDSSPLAWAGGGERPNIEQLIEAVILEAVRNDATDIHFEPFEEGLRLRIRIDGSLVSIPLPERALAYSKAVVSSIKVMAQLNVAEHRKPQDGRFQFDVSGRPYDIRVSILPSAWGEAANLRLLNRASTFLSLDKLGLQQRQAARFESLLSMPHGMVLFTGPTGSGKTTSMYASIDRLNSDERKIITLEDPIEYKVAGVNQMQVNPSIDFGFATGLRSILRHDPDVVLVGEIRDVETAQIAVSASLTGHLVFSSLHTNDAAGAIPRLLDMGIEPYLVASCLEGVIAQRLVRCICPRCRIEETPDPQWVDTVRSFLPEGAEAPRFYTGEGCRECMGSGFRGRRAIYEVLLVDDEIRRLTVSQDARAGIQQRAREQGMSSLQESGWRLVAEGITSVAEVLRVTQKRVSETKRDEGAVEGG